MIYQLPDMLSAAQIAQIRGEMDPGRMVDGMQSAGANVAGIKNNRELSPQSGAIDRLNDIVQKALAANNDFRIIAMPQTVSPFIFSAYRVGEGYGDHTDNAVMGGGAMRTDLAMTIFLSDPAEYDGGELVIDTDIRPTPFKAPPGHAVIYPAFSLHRVEPVTRGVRLAAVTWIQSQVRAPQHRQSLIDIAQTLSWMERTFPQGQAHLHPEFRRLQKVHVNLMRLWAELVILFAWTPMLSMAAEPFL